MLLLIPKKDLLKIKIQSIRLGNPRVGLVSGRIYLDELITQIILKVVLNWLPTQEVGLIRVRVIKYIEKIKIHSVLLGNPRVKLVARRVYFDELITQIILGVDWIGPQRKKLV